MKHHGRFVSPRDRYQPRCTGVLQPAATMGVFRTVEGIKFSKHSPIPVHSILTADDMENRSWSQFSRKWRRRSFYHGNQWNMIFDTREIIYGSASWSWLRTTFFLFLFFFFFSEAEQGTTSIRRTTSAAYGEAPRSRESRDFVIYSDHAKRKDINVNRYRSIKLSSSRESRNF